MFNPEMPADIASADAAVLYYFGTLQLLAQHFPRDGEVVLKSDGYRCRDWVEALYKLAASYGCIGREEPSRIALPFEVFQPYITPEVVAVLCLADDVLRTAYYERCITVLRERLSILRPTRKNERSLKQIRQLCQKLSSQKRIYLRLAYGQRLKGFCRSYNMKTPHTGDIIQMALFNTFDFVPTTHQLYPRDPLAPDLAPLTQLYRKYKHIFMLCKESDSLSPV